MQTIHLGYPTQLDSKGKYLYLLNQAKLFVAKGPESINAQEFFAKVIMLLAGERYLPAHYLVMLAYYNAIGVKKDYNKVFKLACFMFFNAPNKNTMAWVLNLFSKVDYNSHSIDVKNIIALSNVFGIPKSTITKLNESRNPTVPNMDIEVENVGRSSLIKMIENIKVESQKVILPGQYEVIDKGIIKDFILHLLKDDYYDGLDNSLKDKVVLNPMANINLLNEKNKNLVKQETLVRKSEVGKDLDGNPIAETKLYKKLSASVKGQEEAISSIVLNDINIANGISESTGPKAVYFFYGYTGTGKTALAEVLAKNENTNLVVLSMENYTGEDGVGRLIGASQGYKDAEFGGALTNALDASPNAVILFDEVEKADERVIQSLLGLLDRGEIKDGFGRSHDAKGATFIFTSNIGAKEASLAGVESGSEEEKKIFRENIMKKFSPEFLGRLPVQVLFKKLSKELLREILENEIKKLNKRLKNNNIISLTDSAVQAIISDQEVIDKNVRGLKNVLKNKALKNISIPLSSSSMREYEIFFRNGEFDYKVYKLAKEVQYKEVQQGR